MEEGGSLVLLLRGHRWWASTRVRILGEPGLRWGPESEGGPPPMSEIVCGKGMSMVCVISSRSWRWCLFCPTLRTWGVTPARFRREGTWET